MANAGELKLESTDDGHIGEGAVSTLQINLGFRLEPNPQKNGDKSPTHLLFAKSGSGRRVKVGVAWENEIKAAGPNRGKPCFSLVFDDPSFPDWMSNLSAFPGDGDAYQIVTSRPRQAEQGQAAS